MYKYKDIIDFFIYLKNDECINEIPIESYNILLDAINSLKNGLKNTENKIEDVKYLNMAVEEGEEIIKSLTLLKPIAI